MSLTYGVPGWRCVRNRISFTRSRWKNTEFAIAAASAWKIYKTFSRNNAFLRTPRKAGVAVSENKGEGVMFYRITWTRKKERKWQRWGRENCHDTHNASITPERQQRPRGRPLVRQTACSEGPLAPLERLVHSRMPERSPFRIFFRRRTGLSPGRSPPRLRGLLWI